MDYTINGQIGMIKRYKADDMMPDSMTEDELWELHNQIIRHSRLAARILDCTVKDARTLAHYCANKATAIVLRRQGHGACRTYESICERLYSELPAELRW